MEGGESSLGGTTDHGAVIPSDSTHVGLGHLSVFPKTGRPGGLGLCWNLFMCPCGTHIMTRTFGREKTAELGTSRERSF